MEQGESFGKSTFIRKFRDLFFHVNIISSFCFCVSFLGIVIAILLFLFGSPFYVNTSPSAPTGIYIINFERKPVLHKGDYVVVTCPYSFPEIGINKDTVFLKKVKGLCGETFEVTDSALIKDSDVYPINHSLSYLPHLDPGKYTIREDMVLLLNDMDYSLDSRYFGPLPKNLVIHRVHLLLAFQSIDDSLLKILPDWLLLRWFGYIPSPSIDKNTKFEEAQSLGLI